MQRLSRRALFRTVRLTVLGTSGCLAVSVTYNWLAFQSLGSDALRQGLISATVLPVVLAAPLFFYLTVKLRELAILNHKLAHAASRDGLTGLLNRSAFAARAEEAIVVANARTALLVIDADDFKQINDKYGHACGDTALGIIASSIAKPLRSNDVCGRLGGEEFGVLLPETTVAWAEELGARICANVAKAVLKVDGQLVPLSVSVGCAVSNGPSSFEELFRVADRRLYQAKRDGKGKVISNDCEDLGRPASKRTAGRRDNA